MTSNSQVLVIGGSGFIGSRLLARRQWDNIDLKDGRDICDVANISGYKVIVLLAGDLNFTQESYYNNLRIYNALVRLVKDRHYKPHVIFASSAAVYQPHTVKHEERELLRPVTLYGMVKLRGEQIIQDFFYNYTILRFSNVYGDGDGHGAIDIFKRGGTKIYGDGNDTRDYIYVEEAVNAIIKIVRRPRRYTRQIYNISSGIGETTNKIAKEFMKHEPKHLKSRYFDIPYSVLDCTKAKEARLIWQ